MSILTDEKANASKISPRETPGPFLKSIYEHNIIHFVIIIVRYWKNCLLFHFENLKKKLGHSFDWRV